MLIRTHAHSRLTPQNNTPTGHNDQTLQKFRAHLACSQPRPPGCRPYTCGPKTGETGAQYSNRSYRQVVPRLHTPEPPQFSYTRSAERRRNGRAGTLWMPSSWSCSECGAAWGFQTPRATAVPSDSVRTLNLARLAPAARWASCKLAPATSSR